MSPLVAVEADDVDEVEWQRDGQGEGRMLELARWTMGAETGEVVGTHLSAHVTERTVRT